jgi:PhzF family phenazine biosynthesis protein
MDAADINNTINIREFYKVDAFTTRPFKGNPAAVVLVEEFPEWKVMRDIAAELNITETAFIKLSSETPEIRYFTPTTEVPLCGHATIASLCILKLKGLSGKLEIKTKAGDIDAEIGEKFWMRQRDFEHRGSIDDKTVSKALRCQVSSSAVVSTGLDVIVARIGSFEELMSLKPDMAEVEKICSDAGAAGVYAFTFNVPTSSDCAARFFAPAVGIEEDPVTGTAAGALGGYLRHIGEGKDHLTIEQGHALKREGVIHVRVNDGIWVGGDAVVVAKGELLVQD